MVTRQRISMVLIEDSQPFRQGIRTLLNFYSSNTAMEFEVIGEAVTVEQGVALATKQHPTLILLDMELSQGDGITVLSELRAQHYAGKVLVLSVHREDEWVFRAMQAGAQGYVCKDQVADQLIGAITTVLNDQIYLSPDVATGFFRLFHFYAGQSLQACHLLNLTEREQDVLHWLVQGASNDAIADRLHITVATVKAHLTAIFEKLKVTSRTQAIVKALKLGLVSVW